MNERPHFQVNSTAEGPSRTVAVIGELDMSTVPLLAENVNGVEVARKRLTLDLRGVTFMDSSGLRFLIELNDQAKREGWQLAMVAPTDEAAVMVLRVTRADEALPFQDAGHL